MNIFEYQNTDMLSILFFLAKTTIFLYFFILCFTVGYYPPLLNRPEQQIQMIYLNKIVATRTPKIEVLMIIRIGDS